jgi:rod shape-determining protein MreD
MTDRTALRRLSGPLIFTALCLGWLFVQLLPLGLAPGGWPGPDLMLALAMAWIIRRPEDLPVWLLAGLFLTADLLLMRPPGLWAALVLLALEALRRRQTRLRAMPLSGEFAMVAALIGGLTLANWAMLTLLLVEQPGLPAQLAQALSTLAVYPLVVGALHFGLDLRKRPVQEGFGRRARA